MFQFLSRLYFLLFFSFAFSDAMAQKSMLSKSLGFIENNGQVVDQKGKPRKDILFKVQDDEHGTQMFIGKRGFHYQFLKVEKTYFEDNNTQLFRSQEVNTEAEPQFSSYRVDVKLIGANPNPRVLKEEATGYFEKYFLAHCPNGITANSFNKVTLKDVYPGIDWVFYQTAENLKYDFIVHPGADPSQIKLKYRGATDIKLTSHGHLQITTPLGNILEQKPVSFIGDESTEISSSYILKNNILSFEVEPPKDKKLVIDPMIEWGTYYSAGNSDHSQHCIVGKDGSVYIAGYSYGAPGISSGGHQNTYGGKRDAFLAKFDSSGVRQWATFYGGSDYDQGTSCAEDPQGNVYLAGYTKSQNAIAYNGHQNVFGGKLDYDGFLVKFSSSGQRLWATYYGGDSEDIANMCATDHNSNVFLTGYTSSNSNIAMGGYLDTLSGTNGFLAKFDSTGVRQWGTYFGTYNRGEWVHSCAIDQAGNCYIDGTTRSVSGLAFNGHQNTNASLNPYSGDAFLAKFNPAGALIWATYYGGENAESISLGFNPQKSLTIDSKSNVYMAGTTSSNTGIAFNGHRSNMQGALDAYLVKFDLNGVRQWATYYGGALDDYGTSCTTDSLDNVYLYGQTESPTGIAFNGFQNSMRGYQDAFVVKFDSSGVRNWGSYFGGFGPEYPNSCVADNYGNLFLSGVTQSRTHIAQNGHQNTFSAPAVFNSYLIKLDECANTSSDSVTNCTDYYWPQTTKTYVQSGTYYDTLSNVRGCDSILKLHLTLKALPQHIEKVVSCSEFSWPLSGITYTNSVIDTFVISRPNVCDSLAILDLTILRKSFSTKSITACGEYNAPSGNYSWRSSGTYLDTLINKNGCDSILTIHLSIKDFPVGSRIDTACISYLSPSGNQVWTESGLYSDTIANPFGCDSIISVFLTLKKVDISVIQTDSNLIANAKGAYFKWLDCTNDYAQINGGFKSSFTPTVNGKYAVAISKNGCTDTSACFEVSNKATLENPFGTWMVIYPNPTVANLNVQFGKTLDRLNTNIWNTAGKRVYTKQFNTNDRFSIDFPWAPGVYYLEINNSEGKSVIVKIVKI